MEIKEILSRKKQIKTKLMAATSMLLVSSIMLSTTTYAWFTLSTAPEVTDMQTTAGSNGALEIALQSSDDLGNRAEIQHGVGDSSTKQDVTAANNTWGNIVELADNYGLEGISLSPSRLNINTADSNHVNMNDRLKVPQFGIDGRISSLASVNTLNYADGNYQVDNEFGVKVYGTPANLTEDGKVISKMLSRQAVLNTCTRQIRSYRETMLQEVRDIAGKGSSPVVYMMKYGMNQEIPGINETLSAVVSGFDKVIAEATVSLRYALLACASADIWNYPDNEEGQQKYSELYVDYLTLPLVVDGDNKSIKTLATENLKNLDNQSSGTESRVYAAYESVLDAVSNISDASRAIDKANDYIESGATANAVFSMFQTQGLYVKGYEYNDAAPDPLKKTERQLFTAWLENPYSILFSDEDIEAYTEIGLDCGRTQIYMSSMSGLFARMASVVGDYEALISQQINEDDLENTYVLPLYVTSDKNIENYSTMDNEGCLVTVYQTVSNMTATGSVTLLKEATPKVLAYGYSVDLAFKTSENSDLILQQNGVDRVTGESPEGRLPENSTTQGNGSVVNFNVADDLSQEQIQALLQNVYVLFVNTDNGQVYAVATCDDVQLSAGKASADLIIHNAEFSEDGILSAGTVRTDQKIVTLTKDKVEYITAIVYLDGDRVQSGQFSSDTTASLYGSINLQFSTDAELTPMNYDSYVSN